MEKNKQLIFFNIHLAFKFLFCFYVEMVWTDSIFVRTSNLFFLFLFPREVYILIITKINTNYTVVINFCFDFKGRFEA